MRPGTIYRALDSFPSRGPMCVRVKGGTSLWLQRRRREPGSAFAVAGGRGRKGDKKLERARPKISTKRGGKERRKRGKIRGRDPLRKRGGEEPGEGRGDCYLTTGENSAHNDRKRGRVLLDLWPVLSEKAWALGLEMKKKGQKKRRTTHTLEDGNPKLKSLSSGVGCSKFGGRTGEGERWGSEPHLRRLRSLKHQACTVKEFTRLIS